MLRELVQCQHDCVQEINEKLTNILNKLVQVKSDEYESEKELRFKENLEKLKRSFNGN